jgi:hypothetical protein
MGMRSGLSRLPFWGTVTLALPVAYVSSFVAEGGPPMAEGCSGAGPIVTEPGISSVWLPPGPIPVGRDGFFVFNASGYSVTEEQIPEAIELEVRNAAGELVLGELAGFAATHRPLPLQSTFTFGWHASELLGAGQSLSVRLSVRGSDPVISADTTLSATDATAELSQPPLVFQEWKGQTLDVGAAVTCPNGEMLSCSNEPTRSFGADLERSVNVELVADVVPDPAVMTLWQYEVSAVPGKGTLREPLPNEVRFSHYEAAPSLAFFPRFSEVLEEYCLRVTVRDLRTDAALSQDWCSRPPNPMPEFTYDRIKSCASVTPEYLPRWCAGRDPGFSPSCLDEGGAGAGGSAGSGVGGSDNVPTGTGGSSEGLAGSSAMNGGVGGDATTPPAAGSTSAPPSAAGASAEAGSSATGGDAPTDAGTTTVLTEAGCGCRVAPRGAQREAWLSLIALGALGSVWGRRRARR